MDGSSRFWQRILIAGLVIGLALIFLIPLWWSLSWASWHTTQIFSFPPKFLPGPYLWDNFTRLQDRLGIWRALWNSTFISLASAYQSRSSCVRWPAMPSPSTHFRLREALFYILLATMAVPGQITTIPLFILMIRLGWVDTYQAVIIPGLVPAFGVFMMRMASEEALPNELLEAARIDGANELRIFLQIAIPNMLPSIAALSILMFTGTWGALFWPLIVMRSTAMFTLPVAISSILGAYEQPYDLLMAASFISLVPVLILFLSAQRYFIRSMVAGAFR